MAAKTPTFRERFTYIMHAVPGGALLFAMIPLVVFGYLGWYHYGSKRLDQALYALNIERIHLTQQPPWIKTSVLEEVFQGHRLDRVNLLDPAASATIASAFETHPWIEKASRVQKEHGGGVNVDVVYRKPLALVQVYYYQTDASGNASSERKEGYYPVDSKGVVLPVNDFKQNQSLVWDYLMIEVEGMENASAQPGLPINDHRVQEALKLALFLQSKADPKKLGLQWVRVRRDINVTSASPWILELWTSDQRMITWGRSPGAETAGESPADQKLASLTAWLDAQRSVAHGSNSLNLLDSGNQAVPFERTAGDVSK